MSRRLTVGCVGDACSPGQCCSTNNDDDWDSTPKILKASHNCRLGGSTGVEQPLAIDASLMPDNGRTQAYALKLNASKNTTMVAARKDRE